MFPPTIKRHLVLQQRYPDDHTSDNKEWTRIHALVPHFQQILNISSYAEQ
jgi:hypothetical protein